MVNRLPVIKNQRKAGPPVQEHPACHGLDRPVLQHVDDSFLDPVPVLRVNGLERAEAGDLLFRLADDFVSLVGIPSRIPSSLIEHVEGARDAVDNRLAEDLLAPHRLFSLLAVGDVA